VCARLPVHRVLGRLLPIAAVPLHHPWQQERCLWLQRAVQSIQEGSGLAQRERQHRRSVVENGNLADERSFGSETVTVIRAAID